jgi:hypothetical protein
MNRFLWACLIILALLSILLVVSIVIPGSGSPNTSIAAPQSPENLSLSLALAYLGVNTTKATVHSVLPLSETELYSYMDSGYIGFNDTLYIVNLTLLEDSPFYANDIVFVDINQSKIVCNEWYSYRNSPGLFDVTLPPGASFYHILTGGLNVGSIGIYGAQLFSYYLSNLTPKNANVTPILVDGSNLSLMKNGSGYRAAEYIDTNTNMTTVMNGTYTIYPGWSVNASIKRYPAYAGAQIPYEANQDYYIVLKNEGANASNLTIWS